jgi:hypothetical protein
LPPTWRRDEIQIRRLTRLLAAWASALSFAAHAANWIEVSGNESDDAPHIRPLVILQPSSTFIDADPISGLQGALGGYNGHYIFKLVLSSSPGCDFCGKLKSSVISMI